jgi:hypothetical protein
MKKSNAPVKGSAVTDKERKEILNDIFEEDAASLENKESVSRPGWWNYS